MLRHPEQGEEMNSTRIIALLLIVAGVLGLAYGGFSYTKDTQQAKIGPIELSIKEKQTVNIPVWAGAGAIVIGGALLVFGGRKG
jgi:multidrug transporter EmrE-like cation transporter